MEYDSNCTQIAMNSTQSLSNFTSSDIYKLDSICGGVLIPMLCVFGFVGNILNVIIFTQKKSNKVLDEVEYCTTICLVALALSDMMFCFITFPSAFRPTRKHVFSSSDFMLYYTLYNTATISTFIMSSTLMTVLTAVMRYLAICHPFRSRQCITIKSTISAVVIAFIISFAFNVPQLWRFKTTVIKCVDSDDLVLVQTGDLHKDNNFVYSYKILWSILGNFIPLTVLLYCNIRLIKALRMSKQLHLLHSRDDTSCLSAHRRINITLITIIILFFILVAPSEITKFIFYILKEHNKKKYTYTFQVVSIVTNTLQCINFSVNFILYYVIIAPFRKTLNEFVCAFTRPKRNTPTRERSSNSGRQTVVLLSVRDKFKL